MWNSLKVLICNTLEMTEGGCICSQADGSYFLIRKQMKKSLVSLKKSGENLADRRGCLVEGFGMHFEDLGFMCTTVKQNVDKNITDYIF